MNRPFKHIDVEGVGDVSCVSMRERKLTETDVQELAAELLSLIMDEGCRKLLFSFGPGSPSCLYSVFLAKLFTIQRRIMERDRKSVV